MTKPQAEAPLPLTDLIDEFQRAIERDVSGYESGYRSNDAPDAKAALMSAVASLEARLSVSDPEPDYEAAHAEYRSVTGYWPPECFTELLDALIEAARPAQGDTKPSGAPEDNANGTWTLR